MRRATDQLKSDAFVRGMQMPIAGLDESDESMPIETLFLWRFLRVVTSRVFLCSNIKFLVFKVDFR